MLRKIFYTLLVILVLGTLYFSIRLNSSPTFTKTPQGFVNQDVHAQLRFLKAELKEGADNEMQELFPEGYLFIHALNGLAWANVMKQAGKDSTIFKEGLANINSSLKKMQSSKGRMPFDKDLRIEYGAFYKGWINYLLGKKLQALEASCRDSADIRQFVANCEEIKRAFENSHTIYLESYHHETWPADNIVCLASLGVHDQLFAPQYQAFLQKQLVDIQSMLDPATGLIPHAVLYNGIREGARGCSQSLMNIFLPEVDPTFAKQQYALYKKHFVDSRLGLPGIREYRLGQSGSGDVDSGPVIWDIGGSASVVGIGSASVQGDSTLSRSLRNAVEAFGVPITYSQKKKYLFGQLAMADAFIAWVNSMERIKQ